MDFIINFGRGEFARVKSNRMEKVVVVGLKKDGSKGKVRSIGNNCGRESRIEVLEERSGCEGEFKGFKRFDGGGWKVCERMFGSFRCKSMERKGDFRIMMNKISIKIGETKERLNLFNGSGKRPVGDGGEFLWVHLETLGRDEKSEIFDMSLGEFTFRSICKKIGGTKTFEDLFNEERVVLTRFGENKNIINISNAGNVENVMEGILDERLKGSRGIG